MTRETLQTYVAGSIVTVGLTAVAMLTTISVNLFIVAACVGVLGGAIMRSWWSLAIVPAISILTIILLRLASQSTSVSTESELSFASAIALSVALLILMCGACFAGVLLTRWRIVE